MTRYSARMGRLEDIVERNRHPRHNRERIMVSVGLGLFVLLILSLMIFTNLGERPEASEPRERSLEGVHLRSAPRPSTAPN